MRIAWLGLPSLLLSSGLPAVAEAQAWGPRQDPPMVISISWSSPDVRYFRQHITAWEERPFTGTLVHLYEWPYAPAGCVEMGSGRGVSWSVFQPKRFGADMLADTLENLKAAPVTRCRDNFLWVVSFLGGGHFDWFDEERWATVLHNIESLARVAQQGGLRGIVLDCEEYGCPFWSWGGSRPDYALKSFDTYAGRTAEETGAQVRRRGRSFIEALNKGYPGCLVWTLYGYSHVEMPAEGTDLSECGNGLYARFLDGMLEASDDETVFVDGCEGAYRFGGPQDFLRLRRVVTEKALKYTLVPEAYRRKMRVGFGLYMDMYNYPGNHPWYGDRPQDNFRTPAYLETSVRDAIKYSDGYVWIYSEWPSWWLDSPEATFVDGLAGRFAHYTWIPRVYWRALERGMKPLRVPAGFRAKDGTPAEPYTGTGYALEVIHEKTGMAMMFIPAGSRPGRRPAEAAAGPGSITRPFYLGKTEVTQAQWAAIMGQNPMDKFTFGNAERFKGDSHPAVGRILWEDCGKFLEQAGDALRLPTEAEWEHACRAGTTTVYAFGDDPGRLGDHAWYRANSENRTHPVGEKLPNPWGLHDMHGNVFEWCAEGPQAVKDAARPGSRRWHMLRGGSWISGERYCRPAFRLRGYEAPGYAFPDYGLRAARGL